MEICGNPEFSENNLSQAIDVTLAHTRDEIFVSFGSTLENEDPL